MLKQPLKNHVAVLLDVSGSMSQLLPQVKTIFDNQIEFLRKTSVLNEQETRVSVYAFSRDVECLIFDVDVARPMEIRQLKAVSSTSMLDAIGQSLADFKLLPEKYGDHAFIVYVLSDGEENTSRNFNAQSMKKLLSGLPENYSVCAFAPTVNAVGLLKAYGIPEGNIDKWDVTSKGLEEVGKRFEASMNQFYTARSTGVRSMSTVFSDLNKVSVADVKSLAKEVKNYQVTINEDVKAVHIKPLVEEKLNIHYSIGSAFYELVKRETVQESKQVAVQDKKTGKVYMGYEARQLLNLPDRGEVKIDPPEKNSKWIVYVQSTSVNRNIIPKQRVLVLT